jgi:hypothetical protein
MPRLTWTEYSRLWRARNPEKAKQNERRRYLKNRQVKKPRIFEAVPAPVPAAAAAAPFRVLFD